jgi:hypothetical protein
VSDGWLIRDGEVLASLVAPRGWRRLVISTRDLDDGVGAVVVNGPAVVLGTPVARLSSESGLRSVSRRSPVHVVGPGRRAVAVVPAVASALRAGDDLHIQRAS